MEKRLLLAVLLMSAVIIVTNILFPPPEPPVEEAADTVAVPVEAPAVVEPEPEPLVLEAAPTRGEAGRVVVTGPLYRYQLSTRGGGFVRAEMLQYPSYAQEGDPVQLVPEQADALIYHRLAIGADTVDLRSLPFEVSPDTVVLQAGSEPVPVRLVHRDPSGFAIELEYVFSPGSYAIPVRGKVAGLAGRTVSVLTTVGPGLEPHEAPQHHSEGERAFAHRSLTDLDRVTLAKLDEPELIRGPLTWAALKDKYFLAAVVAGAETPLSGAALGPLPPATQVVNVGDGETEELQVSRGTLTTALPVSPDGTFELDLYLGPQEYEQLAAVGSELEDVTPYGYRWMQPVIRPFAALILWVLNTLHDTLGIAYGWVLVLFGVLMRIVLWPLNAKAMRAQLKNAAVAPRMQEIREKYKEDPQKQQEAMLKLYKEEGFNPVAGCLPMLVPFPVLITLFFVFQNTIAFRGAEFLYLPDLSLPDPYYILPIFLVVSMFVLQWISMKMSGMEQNQQMKMMMYVMPIFMGVIFFNLSAGLNLYYAVTNVASIPQQILTARERKQAQEARAEPAPAAPKVPRSRRGKRRAKG